MEFKIDFEKVDLNWDSLNIQNISCNKSLIFKQYYNNVSKSKNKIDNVKNKLYWDKIKRIINPYESIYINYYNSISKYKPLSRSFFKLLEINKKYNLIENKNKINIGCLAEAPGGFIEGIIYKNKHNINNLYGISIYSSQRNIPSWNIFKKKKFYKNNIHLINGDIYEIDDILKYINNFKYQKAELVTSDGGFDFSNNFDNQEIDSHHIIFNEIIISFLILKKNGNFICKFFDIFNIFTIQMIYILHNMFEEIVIYKPNTSRPANSEKYLICKHFKGINKNIYNNCIRLLKEVKLYKYKIIENLKINNKFLLIINKINNVICKNQIYCIEKIINIINNRYEDNNNIIKQLKKNQKIKSTEWCNEHEC